MLIHGGIGWVLGACIGSNAAFLNIVTEWLSDFKHGHCTTAFYLNESFCCWGAEKGGVSFSLFFFFTSLHFFLWGVMVLMILYIGCDEWRRWSSFGLLNYLFYILFSVCTIFPDPPPPSFSPLFFLKRKENY